MWTATPARSLLRAPAALALALALSLQGAPGAALGAGSVSMSGTVYDKEARAEVASGVLYAVHLTTKQVFESAPIGAGGRFSLERLPQGYYDVVVVHGARVYLANRVLNLPAGEHLRASFVLEEPDPDGGGWWSAAPDREVPGLERAPDGVARIVEDESALAKLFERPPAEAPLTAAPSASGSSDWLVPTLFAAGVTAGGLLLTEDNDDAEDEPVSPFE